MMKKKIVSRSGSHALPELRFHSGGRGLDRHLPVGSVRRCRDGQPEGRVAFHHYSQDYVLVANAERATPPPSIAG